MSNRVYTDVKELADMYAFLLSPLLQVNRKWIILKLWKDFCLLISKGERSYWYKQSHNPFKEAAVLPWTFLGKEKKKPKPTKIKTKTSNQRQKPEAKFCSMFPFSWNLVLSFLRFDLNY